MKLATNEQPGYQNGDQMVTKMVTKNLHRGGQHLAHHVAKVVFAKHSPKHIFYFLCSDEVHVSPRGHAGADETFRAR